jgi:hypothetical protein
MKKFVAAAALSAATLAGTAGTASGSTWIYLKKTFHGTAMNDTYTAPFTIPAHDRSWSVDWAVSNCQASFGIPNGIAGGVDSGPYGANVELNFSPASFGKEQLDGAHLGTQWFAWSSFVTPRNTVVHLDVNSTCDWTVWVYY